MSDGCGHSRTSFSRRPSFDIGYIFRTFGEAYLEKYVPTSEQARTLRELSRCRTAALGGHLDECDHCDYSRPAYNSCHNRHCPKCGALRQAAWVSARVERILPIPHFHVVFTLPSELRELVLLNRKLIFGLLLAAGAQTLLTLARDKKRLGVQPGMTGVLHSWARDMSFHPHAHFIVSGGGLSLDQKRWVGVKGKFLLPIEPVRKGFRGRFMHGLCEAYRKGELRLEGACAHLAHPAAFRRLRRTLYRKTWVVHIKEPIAGPEHAYHYLARYVQRVAISSSRLLAVNSKGITFRTREKKTCTLKPVEFIRRFLLHLVPRGFVKVREYGVYASGNVNTRLETARELAVTTLNEREKQSWAGKLTRARKLAELPSWKEVLEHLSGEKRFRCPRCRRGRLLSRPLDPDPPPE